MLFKNKQKKDIKMRNKLKLLQEKTKRLKESNKIKYNYEKAKEKQATINRNRKRRKIRAVQTFFSDVKSITGVKRKGNRGVNRNRRIKSSSKPKGMWGDLF